MSKQQQTSKPRPPRRAAAAHTHGNVYRTDTNRRWRCAECDNVVSAAEQARWDALWQANSIAKKEG